jgi:hypothetical protein
VRRSAPATALPDDGDEVAAAELSFGSEFRREDRVVWLFERRSRGGAYTTSTIKEIL